MIFVKNNEQNGGFLLMHCTHHEFLFEGWVVYGVLTDNGEFIPYFTREKPRTQHGVIGDTSKFGYGNYGRVSEEAGNSGSFPENWGAQYNANIRMWAISNRGNDGPYELEDRPPSEAAASRGQRRGAGTPKHPIIHLQKTLIAVTLDHRYA